MCLFFICEIILFMFLSAIHDVFILFFQVFDLHRLRGVTTPTTFQPDVHYNGVGNCHNIVSNEETGYIYAVGCSYGSYPNLCDGKRILSTVHGY